MSTNYFDLEDILTTEEKLDCYIRQSFKTCEQNAYVQGNKTQLPCWLVEAMHDKTDAIQIDLETIFGDKLRTILSASASTMNLNQQQPHFYALGLKVAKLGKNNQTAVAKALAETFYSRFGAMLEKAKNYGSNKNKCKVKLDRTELKLVELGCSDWLDVCCWYYGRRRPEKRRLTM